MNTAPAAGHPKPLLGPEESPAFSLIGPPDGADIVLACDHASAAIPRSLGNLGLTERELASHIAWDIGTAGMATHLAERLQATLVMQNWSRLVIDCNRPLEAPDSIPTSSEWGSVPGNENLDQAQVDARREALFEPYHQALASVLDGCLRARRPVLLVSLHSFTPRFRAEDRPWHIGVMHRGDTHTGNEILRQLRRDERLVVGDNQPYAIEDGSDYTLPFHGETRRIAHVGLEIRQDLIAEEAGQKTWAGRLASLLKRLAREPASRGA